MKGKRNRINWNLSDDVKDFIALAKKQYADNEYTYQDKGHMTREEEIIEALRRYKSPKI